MLGLEAGVDHVFASSGNGLPLQPSASVVMTSNYMIYIDVPGLA